MDPTLENLDINGSSDEITECIEKFNFWIGTRESCDEKAIEGAFLTAVGKETVTLLKTLAYVKVRFHRKNNSASRQAYSVRIRRTDKVSQFDPQS